MSCGGFQFHVFPCLLTLVPKGTLGAIYSLGSSIGPLCFGLLIRVPYTCVS
jgi:hypothetical protein